MGVVASGESFLTSKGGGEVEVSLDVVLVVEESIDEAILTGWVSGLRRLARGEFGKEGGRWAPFLLSFAGGVAGLVIIFVVCRAVKADRRGRPLNAC